MPKSPNPRELGAVVAGLLTPESVGNYKQVLCKQYGECLYFAAMKKWPNFHCNQCEAFEEIDKNELIREANRIKESIFHLHKTT